MSIKSLQTKIGAKADGAFGPKTMKAAMAFYKTNTSTCCTFLWTNST